MFFRKKINRVLNVKEAEERFQKDIEKTPLEKKDRLAMILAGLIVFVPAIVLILLIFLAVAAPGVELAPLGGIHRAGDIALQ